MRSQRDTLPPVGIIYREALPVALATHRTISMKGAHVKGVMDFLCGCTVRLEVRPPQGTAISATGTVTRVYRRGARIDFAPHTQDTQNALQRFLSAGA